MTKQKILIQLDCDRHPSVFDRVVAIDAGVDEVFSYGGVEPGDVLALAHGAIFTRGVKHLHQTAFFVGGSDVGRAERILDAIVQAFFGPMRCSVMLDANGSNTTASAAVRAGGRHVDLAAAKALVLGATGPVGQRVALLLAREGAEVWLGSRNPERAAAACARIRRNYSKAKVAPAAAELPDGLDLVISAAAAGVRTLDRSRIAADRLRVLVDLNAVPPAGIEGVEITDNGRETGGIIQYGAIGIGGVKMALHKKAIASLFEANDRILDAEKIHELALDE